MSKKKPFFFLLIPFLLFSCATAVIFDVEHPPLIDLRSMNSITVIPFEWNSTQEYHYLSMRVTSALINGIKKGNINFVDPYESQNISLGNYGKIADVYITGRISDIRSYNHTETKDELNIYRNEIIKKNFTVVTMYVDITYSYIRSADNAELGTYQKTGISSSSYEQGRGRNTYRYTGRQFPDTYRQRGRGRRGTGVWPVNIADAEAAVLQFSNTMNRELGPWTTTEKRMLKRSREINSRAAEAGKFIRQSQYGQALDIYSEIYKQNGGVKAGYNTAILLAATGKFSGALDLLEIIQNGIQQAGKNSPLYIRKEINTITKFINWYKILESYKTSRVQTVSNTGDNSSTTALKEAEADGNIRGMINPDTAMIYALNGPVSSIDDPSVFSKIIASANVEKGLWSMKIPDNAPALLWYIAIDYGRRAYISKTALASSGTVILALADMIRLE